MSLNNDTVTFQKKELKGSRLRCLMLTSLPDQHAARFLNGLVHPHATVGPLDNRMPRGFQQPGEAKLGEDPPFLSDDHRESVTAWWLKVRRNANTPNWDLVSQATVDGKPGLILVEAKAYVNAENMKQIAKAIAEADRELNEIAPGWALKASSHYQISNRFAWAWKVASLGVPVVLVYLGFLNAEEMQSPTRKIFRGKDEWRKGVLKHATGIVPPAVWEQGIKVNGTPLRALIRSMDVNVAVEIPWKA